MQRGFLGLCIGYEGRRPGRSPSWGAGKDLPVTKNLTKESTLTAMRADTSLCVDGSAPPLDPDADFPLMPFARKYLT